jgi:ABC-type branched-subunit amino acid transport system substrate-binding protein
MKARRDIHLVVTLLLMMLTATGSSAIAPSSLTIGGFFNIYDANGVANNAALQHLSAFLLAIDQINQLSDLLPNTTINYVIRNAYNLAGATDAMADMVTQGASGIISSLSKEESFYVNALSNGNNLLTINTGTIIETSLTATFPHSFQISPLESFQGKLFQNLLCEGSNGNFSRTIVYASQDENYMKIYESLNGKELCLVDIVNVYTFPPTTTNFDSAISNGIDDQVSTIYIMMPQDMGALFLQQAYDQGLIRLGVTVIGTANLLDNTFISKFVDPQSTIHGILGVADAPYYNIYGTPAGRDFINGFLTQTSTVSTCGLKTDETGYHYLYRNGSSMSGPCVGLNFTTLTAHPIMIYYDIAYTYDAVYTWAWAMDSLLKQGAAITAAALSTKVEQTQFTGSSGNINFDVNKLAADYGRKRNRVGGFSYMFYQYQSDGNAIFPISAYTLESGLIGCFDVPSLDCREMLFNTADNLPPNGYPPYTFAEPPVYVRVAGVFNLYDKAGKPIKDQVECFAAFLMAINEVNNKIDGIFDELLPASKVVYEVAFGADYLGVLTSVGQMLYGYFGRGLLGAVSALDENFGQSIDEFLANVDMFIAKSKSLDVKQGTKHRLYY